MFINLLNVYQLVGERQKSKEENKEFDDYILDDFLLYFKHLYKELILVVN